MFGTSSPPLRGGESRPGSVVGHLAQRTLGQYPLAVPWAPSDELLLVTANITEFASDWDWDVAAQFHPIWQARNYLSGSLMDVAELVRVVEHVLQCGASANIRSVTVTPRPAA